MKPQKQTASVSGLRRYRGVVWMMASLISIATVVVLIPGSKTFIESATGWVASSQRRPVDGAAHRSKPSRQSPQALPRTTRLTSVEPDPATTLSDHQRAFVQPTLAALDSRLTSHNSQESRAAIVAYRQRLIERARGIDTPMKDGE